MTIEEFMKSIEEKIASLMREIEAIYPELGRQTYRVKDLKNWAIEQHLTDITAKDEEIARLKNMRDDVLAETKNRAVSA